MKNRRVRTCVRIGICVVLVLLIATCAVVARSSPLNPVSSIGRTIGFLVSGRLHFPRERIGQIVTDDEGRQFTIFREVTVDPAGDQPEHPGARLILHFSVTNMSPAMNRLYSFLPLALYIGDPGFRSKVFTIDGERCQSLYEWDTARDAENYVGSIALKSILRRAVPGSVSIRIVPLPE